MLSPSTPAAAPATGAALPAAPAPQTCPADPSADAYLALTRTQSEKYDADRAFWAVRDEYYGPGRQRRLREALARQQAARAAFAAAAKAYAATPRAQLEARIRARHNEQYGTFF